MITLSFFQAALLYTLVWIALRAVVWLCKRRIIWRREAALGLMFVNLLVLLRVTFFPLSQVDGVLPPLVFDIAALRSVRLNLVPLKHLLRFATRRDLLLNLIGNWSMFIPSGIILPILYPKMDSFCKVMAGGALISLGIELLQLPVAARATDVDDLILNLLGCATGYGIYALIHYLRQSRKGAKR